MCVGVSSDRDREVLLTAAEKAGWEPPRLEETGGGVRMWEVAVSVAWLVVEGKRVLAGSSKEKMYCFLRYRFFDLGE